jgi:hypothetical protein
LQCAGKEGIFVWGVIAADEAVEAFGLGVEEIR